MNNDVNAIVIGAGRLGSNIAKRLSKENNDVLLIDKNRGKLGNVSDFSGFMEVGDATDLSFLEDNGIQGVDRVVIITDDDNTNIFLSDVCSNIYSVPEIYIRLKDSRKIRIVNPRVKCICPFDLSLDEFVEQSKGGSL